jgi:hypothetical protein
MEQIHRPAERGLNQPSSPPAFTPSHDAEAIMFDFPNHSIPSA